MGQFIDLTAADGFSLQAWRAEPSGVPRGGLVVQAGHAFNNDTTAQYEAASARMALERTLAFLREHVG